MNNLSEAFNATILVASDKAMLITCQWIKTYLINKISTFKSKLDICQHGLSKTTWSF